LSKYTPGASSHLASLSWKERFSRTLSTNETQHHLMMIEIELMNRMHSEAFRNAEKKIALLPHCLRDLEAQCRSAHQGLDYVCRNCSKRCAVHAVGKALRRSRVEPYLWMNAKLGSFFKAERRAGRTVAVFGVACIPKLAHGMRRCAKAGVPALGVPLDANRCVRWWGEFHPNSVNISQVEKLLAGN
jgi:uncharacterized protein